MKVRSMSISEAVSEARGGRAGIFVFLNEDSVAIEIVPGGPTAPGGHRADRHLDSDSAGRVP